jgi:T-complex protein 1 subunit eta
MLLIGSCLPPLKTSLQQPQIILLKEGTDTSQGTAQLVSNINACMALADTVRTTLGPRGMDKLIHDDKVGCCLDAAAGLLD